VCVCVCACVCVCVCVCVCAIPKHIFSPSLVAQALILARTIGWTRSLADLRVEPLFPPALSSLPLKEFFAALPGLDADFTARVEAARANESVLRYVVSVRDGQVEVGLKEVPAASPLGRLRGTDNILEIYSDVYYKQPLVVQGAGAGAEVTASGVVGDLVNLALKHVSS
jgi:homoserine dehydrogenase